VLRRTELRLVPPVDRRGEPGYRAWHSTVFGNCAVCGIGTQRLERHHVVAEQHLRAIGVPCWDLRDSLLVGAHCRCHRNHTTAASRIPASKLTPESIEFAIEVLGAEVAELYLERYYQAA
jgi:hypothetical protein